MYLISFSEQDFLDLEYLSLDFTWLGVRFSEVSLPDFRDLVADLRSNVFYSVAPFSSLLC